MTTSALPANSNGTTPKIDPANAAMLLIESYSKAREVELKHEVLDSQRK